MNRKAWVSLIIWIVVFEAIGFLLGLLTQANLNPWYAGLNKSSLTPPGILFSIVWPILYALLAIVGWTLWRYRNNPKLKPALYLYFLQMLMNWAWTLLFFHWHWIGLSLLWILILTGLNVVILFMMIKNEQRVMTILLVPYVGWLLFASYLNAMIWHLN